METSPANRLPAAASLPDGFVESSAECPTAPPRAITFVEGLLDLDLDQPDDSPAAESLQCESAVKGTEKRATPSDSGDSVRGKESTGVPDDYKETKLTEPQDEDEVVIGLPSVDSRGECRTSEQGCLEFNTTDLKEGSSTENTDCSKDRKLESVEVKRKVGKRNIKSEKELLEFTLKYQKVITERDAAIAVRERLESLCRELQRQNRMLMDECQRVSSEGQTMRLDLSTKFNDAIKDINIKLEEQKDDCLSQLKENDMLRDKLKHLADQYTLSEQQFAQKLKQKTLELQLADLKIQQHEERSSQEQNQMQLYVEQVTQLLATEKNLRLQLAADGEKFQQFQDALLKSNEVFETFKQEMEKMAKLIKELKKENEFLKSKCEKSDIALVKLVEERELMKKQVEKAKNQKEKLESLCRSLQAERKQVSAGSTSASSVNTQQVKTSSTEDDL